MLAPIIVLEGLDACGKSTQTDLLLASLKEKKISVGWKKFPQYEGNPAGARIAAYLRGELGAIDSIDPKIIASLYAADRLYQIDEIEKMRTEHQVIIFDRSVSANLIYTPARVSIPEAQDRLVSYIENLEYEVFGFPKESLVIYLNASNEARNQMHEAKHRIADLHEANEEYLNQVREVALRRCESDFRWKKIEVDEKGIIRPKEEIAQEILNLVLEKLQITN